MSASKSLPNARSSREIAIICDTIPYPTRSGDNQRIAELITVLREEGWYVHLVLCGPIERRFSKICRSHVDALHIYNGQGAKVHVRNAIRRTIRTLDRFGSKLRIPPLETIASRVLGHPISPLIIDYWNRYPKGLSEFVADLDARFRWRAVIVEYIWLYPTIDQLKNTRVRLLDTHDVQHKRVEEFASRGMVFPLQITRNQEQQIFNRFDAVIAIQAAEAATIQDMCPQLRVLTVGSSGRSAIALSPPIDGRILYVGGYNGANIDGLRRFLVYIWPKILRDVPNAHLHICGHVCRAFSGRRFRNVHFLGHKERLEKDYAEAVVVINPAWIGTGLKIKTVEALNYGKALVTTSKGIEGLPCGADHITVIANDDDQFAGELVRLLMDPQLRQKLSESALAYADKQLNKQAVYRDLFRFLNQIT